MEEEDEESLERVEDGEDIGHCHRLRVDVHKSEHPGQAEENHKDHSTLHPRPVNTNCYCSMATILW